MVQNAVISPVERSSDGNGRGGAIRFSGVDKHFETFPAVRNLNLEINDGELLVLLGPSGCGKTTTLNMLAGLEQPTGGQLLFGDQVMNKVPPEERDIAMVFQSIALYPHLNVRENIGFALKSQRADRATHSAAGRRSRQKSRHRQFPRAQNPPALRWATAAGRHRQGAGAPPAPVPARRAIFQSGRRIAPPDARGDRAHPPRASKRPWSSSRTTRKRRWRSPTGSA